MEKKLYTHKSIRIPYYVRGANPGLLLLSGAHGDEFEVIDSVHAAVDALGETLPDFLYVPEVSPSSVASRARNNYRDKDINRQFVDGTECEEAQAVMGLLKGQNLETCVSFHEDPVLDEFYLYDTGEFLPDQLQRIRSIVRKCGVGLFSGIDDPEDEYLQFEFKDGYRPHVGANGTPEGPLETWLIRQGIIKRVFSVEVPGTAAKKKKDTLVKCLFEHLCLV